MLTISREDFHLVPTKLSIGRFYYEHLSIIRNTAITHEDLYDLLSGEYVKLFNQDLPWASYDSFRMWYKKHMKEFNK